MITQKKVIALLVAGIVIGSGCAVSQTYSEEELGLRKVDLYSEKNVVADNTAYSTAAAGESKVFERSYENAPPMIPHDVEGMLDMSKDNNACLGCHLPEVAEAVKATPIPKSHFFDMRTQKVLNELSQARFNCSQCHAPQSNNEPLVKNEFKPDFRAKDAQSRSHLLDSLNEGVK
ncbi:MAG: nitrate reductase cytochrome c-type subunit [Epsilonproteobacteria bacterium]|uniref:nitrate reductase cytochrome c-type subunit n=1 Tax=unclassified Sulfurospirillum TaxID=2618290 RepID=UPI00054390A8|nr:MULTISPECIES: nitrate reductase cytochrome c-type subunit [unclassified Sulfurospirillum]KHG33135.1 MAG: nitrate reductase [Sulfurospirillum sp. MES]MCP3651735.1 nitrate reductase cytochrome c-type subunit [Sulfurospirillum sp. DNRA8]MCR1810582.1 nitrate reductase cytochrome c-type subunit [Sulfurospirillum sp. DNRA8]NCB53376.1 nitrate reductase cytochrome c-type subunit [Campylobacterota bacterium]